MIPASYSVCRGQADQGIGEAGTPISRGEQYLAADAPLRADPDLLRAIRHWLTLDADPGDQGRLQERLTGWSCFPAGPWYCVARLGAAGKYDRRDAYFAHGRAWPMDAFTTDFDPGLVLGQETAFLKEAATLGTATADLGDAATLQREALDAALTDPALTASLIAHLFHGLVTGLPVILAVPLTAFAAADPLARLVAFARAALPGRLRRRCRIRVFTRNPVLFLGPDPGAAADLLVIPEDLAGAALTAVRRRALLLDARGERCDGPAPAADLFDYARAVIASAQRFPAHLTRCGERFGALWADSAELPGPALTGWVGLTYNLAVALAGGPAHCGSLFANHLLTQARAAPQVPWSMLIRPDDWAHFPRDLLNRFILRADEDLSPGEGRLQAALIEAFQRLGITLDEGLPGWWNPADAAKVRRLLVLCDLAPPLVSAAGAAALTGPLGLAALAAGGGPLTGALRAEVRAGVLGARAAEATELLALLDQPGLFDLLLEADQSGALPAPWRSGDLAAMPVPQAQTLALRLLRDPGAWDGLDDLPTRLFARLGQAPGGFDAVAADLVDQDGRLCIDPTPALAALLLATAPIAGRLGCRALLALGAVLPATAGPALAAWHERIADLMTREPPQTTGHLIQAGAWLAWRRQAGTGLDADARRRFALLWLTSPTLAALREDGARTRPPQWRPGRAPGPVPVQIQVDCTRETWDQVMADLDALAPAEIRLLSAPATHWPWIHPFQQDQARDLTERCRDPRARALLTAHLARAAPGSDAGPETGPAPPWVAEVVAALADAGDDERDAALTELRQRLQDHPEPAGDRAAPHPLVQLEQAIRALPPDQRRRGSPLIAHGWGRLQRVIAGADRCFRPDGSAPDRPLLPLFQLAASLRPERQAGTLALWFMYQPDCAPLRLDPGWWAALIGSVMAQTAVAGLGCGSGCGPTEATRQAALALIEAERAALPRAEGLALELAWQASAEDPNWTDPGWSDSSRIKEYR